MPAEWERHEATWLAWPHNRETWPTQLPRVEEAFLRIVEALSPGEDVRILVRDPAEKERAVKKLAQTRSRLDRVFFFQIPTADVWIRDYGPNFILKPGERPESAFNRWDFNAWGGKYDSLRADDKIAPRIASVSQTPYYEPGMVLEGGSIDVNGSGSVLVTEQCLLNPNRNFRLERPGIEAILRDHLGVRHFIWLGEGIAGDDTDGHVDDIARFVSRDTVICAAEGDPGDENYAPLQDNLKRLRAAVDETGAPLTVVELPMPRKIESDTGRLPATYANFYIGNAAVLVPAYAQPEDAVAASILGRFFPGRQVVSIPSRDLVYGLGAVHCVTQQQPAF
jgi:agmatine deiminase